jgi:hypothetical protein
MPCILGLTAGIASDSALNMQFDNAQAG